MSIIKVENLCKSFGSLNVLDNVNLTVEAGEKIAIIGPSGCGKSVFLRSLDLLEKPDSGHIFIDGREITAQGADVNGIRKNVGMVYQGFHLFEHLNVIDNITLAPRKLKKTPRLEAEMQAVQLLKSVGLESKKYEMPNVLSGGQKQRIAIARCLAMEPKVMLFDEPTSALDPAMVGEVLATIRMLAKRKMTMIIVTHEMNFAYEVADRVLFFDRKGIYEQGTPQMIFDAPQKTNTIAFIKKLKIFSFRIESRDFDLMKIRGGIMDFAEKYGIPYKAAYRLELCAEELIYELLNNCYPEQTLLDLHMTVEYSEADKSVILSADCGGIKHDPFADTDDENLGVTIIRRAAKKHTYAFEENRNITTITL